MVEYDFKDEKYDAVRHRINEFKAHSFEEIRKLSFMQSDSLVENLNLLKMLYKNDFPEKFSADEWIALVDDIDLTKNKKTAGLIVGAINDFEIEERPGSQWFAYKEKLKEKKFSFQSIENIENSSKQITQRLSKKTYNSEPIQGLVIGDVQSGKTANMIGLMSMAADYGFNFFIILSGVIENLRKQTESRIYSDVRLEKSRKNWNLIEKPSLGDRNVKSQWENINLAPGSDERHFVVSLKQRDNLDSLIKWLYSDEKKLKQMKILVIDDEADQASINTNDLNKNDRTTINRLLTQLVNGYKGKKIAAVNYISFTATPFANVLSEPDGLFPNHFVFTLPISDDYIGSKQIFGLKEPESVPALQITRNISNNDFLQMKEINAGKTVRVPESFKEAITWFFITSAIFRVYNYKTPVSMLIHTTHITDSHEYIARAVETYLKEIRQNKEDYYNYAHSIFNRETVDLTKQDFVEAMPRYSSTESIREYPSFIEIKKQLKRVLDESLDRYATHIKIDEDRNRMYHEGFHIIIDNHAAKADGQEVRLFYPKKGETKLAPMFIVIGGNTLSRGLTLEGLTTSYFLRPTKQADTLLQMGRWFGYRKGYELLPRIWLDNDARLRFQEVSQITHDLVKEIELMAELGQSPREYGVRVKTSPDNAFLRITAANKMRGAIETDLDFQRINKSTYILENDYSKLKNNKQLTIEFLNKLRRPRIDDNLMIFDNINYETILDYLRKFQFAEKDSFFRNIDTFIEWFEQVSKDPNADFKYANWNIIVSTLNIDSKASENSEWIIHGNEITPVLRSQDGEVQDDGKTYSIGSLVSTSHYVKDLNPKWTKGKKLSELKMEQKIKLRNEAGLGQVPLLLIYPINKASEPNRNTTGARSKLRFFEDPVGIGLFIPGDTKSKNMAKHFVIKPSNVYEAQDNGYED